MNNDDYFQYLNELETWGVSNISEAAPYLLQHFPALMPDEARKILKEWSDQRRQLLSEGRVGA